MHKALHKRLCIGGYMGIHFALIYDVMCVLIQDCDIIKYANMISLKKSFAQRYCFFGRNTQ